MKTISKYVSVFILASCMFVAVPSQAMDLVVKVKDTIITNRYASASIIAVAIIGSYLCKRFFRNDATVNPNLKKDDVVVQKKLDVISEPAISEQIALIAPSVVLDDKQEHSVVISVVNSHDQNLDFCISTADDNDGKQFSIPNNSYAEIHIDQ